MKRLADQIKQALNALAYADMGERVGRFEKYAALGPSPAARKPRQPAPAPKLIALGVGETLPAPVMAYVIGACRRMQAGLLLLTRDASRVRAQIADYLPDLDGIRCEAEELDGASHRAVLRVLQRRSNVLFAVSGTPDDPVHSLIRGRRGLLAGKTPVPVVMVGPEPRKSPSPELHTAPAGAH